jgi:uncharacterized protein YkwD
MRRRTYLAPLLGAFLGALAAVSVPRPAAAAEAPRSAAPAGRFDAVRLGLLARINAERKKLGSPPLVLNPAVSRAADEHAAQVSQRGDLRIPPGSDREMQARLKAAGYSAHRWIESLCATSAPLDTLIAEWKKVQPKDFVQAMAPDLRHLGIGISHLGSLRLYTLLAAVPADEAFERQTGALKDVAAARRAMLAAVNDFRQKSKRPTPLVPSVALDRVAQRHADDLLARAYFAHKSPDGKSVRERAAEEGYAWRAIGENLAEGQSSVAEAVDAWRKSPEHREVMLAKDFRELGLGLARGRDPRGEWRVIWVLVLGTPVASNPSKQS